MLGMKIARLLDMIMPPPPWRGAVIVLAGIGVGMVLLDLHLGRATSYLFDDPSACVNCHVMAPYYATWQGGSHGRVATCNDCHVPHGNILHTYVFKAIDGARHSSVFTFHLEPHVIRITNTGKDVVQQNCIRCHKNTVAPISLRALSARTIQGPKDGYCWDCHRETPHGTVNSLTAAPYARVPRLTSAVPSWIEGFLGKEHFR